LIDGKHEAERAYFMFTKKQEPITNIQHNYWDPDTRNFKEINLAELAEQQITKYPKIAFSISVMLIKPPVYIYLDRNTPRA
jgi:hypothetical protein